jgi:hypothetical protein
MINIEEELGFDPNQLRLDEEIAKISAARNSSEVNPRVED